MLYPRPMEFTGRRKVSQGYHEQRRKVEEMMATNTTQAVRKVATRTTLDCADARSAGSCEVEARAEAVDGSVESMDGPDQEMPSAVCEYGASCSVPGPIL